MFDVQAVGESGTLNLQPATSNDRSRLDHPGILGYFSAMAESIQYITDDEGKKTSVILPIAHYEQLLEDLDDLACVAERRDEESVPFEAVLTRLKEDGIVLPPFTSRRRGCARGDRWGEGTWE